MIRFVFSVMLLCQAAGYVQSAPQPSSSINRLVAFYRSLVGIPTDREPPAAR